MSAGKSTFINAMFADDVLPAYSEATTDCPIYIYSDDNPANDKAIIEFTDDRTPVELSKRQVKKELKFYAQKDTDELDEKYKNVYRIHLYWDFPALQNKQDSELKFVFIDTPGPNNTDRYQKRHYNFTEDIILNEADMIFYLFDYGQIDANLELSKGNIWDLLQKRKEMNGSVEVFFIINKIDIAFNDNKKLSKVRNSKSKEEFYKNLKEYWFYHEQRAIEKIKKTAKKYGFSHPKVFTASAEYEKLIRMKSISWDDEEKIASLKKIFVAVFKDKWEEQLINYLNVSWIEDNTRFYLKNIEEQIKKETV